MSKELFKEAMALGAIEMIDQCAKVCDEWANVNATKTSEAYEMGYTEEASYHRGAAQQLAGCAEAIRALKP